MGCAGKFPTESGLRPHPVPSITSIEKKRASRPWFLDVGQVDFLAPVRLREDVLSMRIIMANESRARSKEGIDERSERRAFGED
jgi:hypothetical protein